MMKFLLVACGSYNPIHNMHLRMFELVRDSLKKKFHEKSLKNSDFQGLISATSDAYKKKGLQPFETRAKLIEISTKSSNWINLSRMEGERSVWTPTAKVLEELNDLF